MLIISKTNFFIFAKFKDSTFQTFQVFIFQAF